MKIDIDPETIDGIVRAALSDDLRRINADIRMYSDKFPENIYQNQSDLKRYAEAIKTLQEWYGK